MVPDQRNVIQVLRIFQPLPPELVITCSKFTIATLEQDAKYIQS